MISKYDSAHKILDMMPKNETIELCYSGGKDSDVILYLAREHGCNIRPIYKKTTIDPPYTIAHCRDNCVEVFEPKYTFAQILRKVGIPNRFHRICCYYLKEYKILDNVILGVRQAESKARQSRYTEPTRCRMFGKEHQQQFLPIFDWSDDDVANFIITHNIKCHPLYYPNGHFDVTKRLGCIGCPLQSCKKRKDDFRNNKGFIDFYAKNADIFCKSHNKPFDGYQFLYMQLTDDWSSLHQLSLFPVDYKQLLYNL